MESLKLLGELTPQKRAQAQRDFLSYAFRVIPYTDMVKMYQSDAVQRIARDGTMLLDGKCYVYNQACGEAVAPGDVNLSAEDKRWLSRAAKHPPLAKKLASLRRAKYEALLPADIEQLAGTLIGGAEFTAWLSRFIAKKHSFLISSYGVTRDDLLSDMKASAYYAILRAYPEYQSALHVLNIGKTAAHNRGINIISEYTAESRNRLIVGENANGERTFGATNVSLDMESAGTPSGNIVIFHENLVVQSPTAKVDMTLAFQQLQASLPPRKREFLRLMRGERDEAFSTFLGEANDDFADRVPYDTLLKRVCAFLDVDREAASRFVTSLRGVM